MGSSEREANDAGRQEPRVRDQKFVMRHAENPGIASRRYHPPPSGVRKPKTNPVGCAFVVARDARYRPM